MSLRDLMTACIFVLLHLNMWGERDYECLWSSTFRFLETGLCEYFFYFYKKCGKCPSKYWFENMEAPLRSHVTVISQDPRITKDNVEQRNYLSFFSEHVSSHLLISHFGIRNMNKR